MEEIKLKLPKEIPLNNVAPHAVVTENEYINNTDCWMSVSCENAVMSVCFDCVGKILSIKADILGEINKENVLQLVNKAIDSYFGRIENE